MALPHLTADGQSQMNQKGTWEGVLEWVPTADYKIIARTYSSTQPPYELTAIIPTLQ